MKFRFLGTGTSVGVPQIGCSCKVCTSADPRDKRRRCGAYVTASDGTAFLIDTPPELRLSCVEYGISKVDAIVLTHAHMDHVAGFDDVRRFNTLNGTWVACDPNEPGANGRTCRCIGKPMTCYARTETAEQMHRIFPYIGLQGGQNGLFRPQIGFETADRFEIGSIKVERLSVEHGFPCCGYLMREGQGERSRSTVDGEGPRSEVKGQTVDREGQGERSRSTVDGEGPRSEVKGQTEDEKFHCSTSNLQPPTSNLQPSTSSLQPSTFNLQPSLAYISDCHVIPDETVEKIRGVGTLVLNCLREREHPTHLSLARALEYVERIKPGRTYLIHMCHDFTHEEWLAKLAGTTVEPAYDGLVIEV